MDALCSGRKLKCLTVVDDFSRECVQIGVDHSIGGQHVTRLLDQCVQFRGYPEAIRTDQGTEFARRAFMAWTQAHGIRHVLNDAGCPTQNAYIESFNGRFRDECLNEHWFLTLGHARQEIARWRRDYNEVRPHGSVGRIPPGGICRPASPACRRRRANRSRCSTVFNRGTPAGGRSGLPPQPPPLSPPSQLSIPHPHYFR